ncbi:hypothetical protein J6352_10880 [Burkholderia pseudomallei]|uniref:hypothetical protein n=1 Tax=Burkholderia pseudomallei TaxID=28450 RepID=UPI001AD73476|nr:hypothetical protein [Burkholderia pseudomallei]MBO7773437.1 hypothetical protein [Burkholderia pseudomallei]MBO7905884.1 hypothetical protein [Burkholderia pseudomallei]
MSTLPNVTLGEFYALVEHNPVQRNMIHRQYVKTYDEFIELFYEMLDYAISRLEENPQNHQQDGEDQLTDKLVGLLQMAGYNASHGTTGGGSKDLTVKWLNPEWSWIGEAKLFKSLTDVREGFLQLTTRYRNSNPLYTRGGLIVYTLRQKAALLLKEWIAEAAKLEGYDNFRSEDCPRRPNLAYKTFHDHEASGLPCEIRHIAVVLYFLPKDRSGRTAKRYRGAAPANTADAAVAVDPTSDTERPDPDAAQA